MACYGGIKTYHLIHLDFRKDTAEIFEYQKDRRYTSNQAWNVIHHTEPVERIPMKRCATMFTYDKILKNKGYDEKHCDRYMTFDIS